LNCDNRRCLCVFHSTKCLLLFGGRHLEYFVPTGTAAIQSKLGVSSSNLCNLHHSPHTGHLENKIKKGYNLFRTPCINLDVHNRIQNSPLLALISSNTNPVYTFVYCFCKVHINIILNSGAQIPAAS